MDAGEHALLLRREHCVPVRQGGAVAPEQHACKTPN
eukprot:COSAG04_NODE_16558_length_495_cov_1.563131_1_plen_35_part_10